MVSIHSHFPHLLSILTMAVAVVVRIAAGEEARHLGLLDNGV